MSLDNAAYNRAMVFFLLASDYNQDQKKQSSEEDLTLNITLRRMQTRPSQNKPYPKKKKAVQLPVDLGRFIFPTKTSLNLSTVALS